MPAIGTGRRLKPSGAAGQWTDSFESDDAVIYALDRDDRLIHCNRAWDRFALENDGARVTREHQLHRCIFDAIPASLTPFYRELYAKVRADRREHTHVMECSSPQVLRRFHMSIRPFGESGLLTVNALVDEIPQGETNRESDASYVDQDGIVTQCSHCRRTRNVQQTDRWDWVPRFLRNDWRISHGLCPVCVNYHYGLTIQ
jgi:hypothetical protein